MAPLGKLALVLAAWVLMPANAAPVRRSDPAGTDPVALSHGRVVERDLTILADYTLAFDIHPTGTEQDWASILHYTNSGTPHGNRVPAIFFRPGTTKLQVCVGYAPGVGQNPGQYKWFHPDQSLPLNQWSSVRVQVAGATAKITINGRDFDYSGLPARPAVTSGVTLYAADPWYVAARASIRLQHSASTPDYQCTCSNGNPAGGDACTANGELCASCDAGYTLSNGQCNLNTCTCNHGIGATGASCPQSSQPICAECSAGYHLENSACVLNTCSCSGGTGATGTSCPTHNGAKCVGCDNGYHLDGNACVEDYMCTEEVNFITGAGYSQDTMCGSVAKVIAECKAKCDKIGCTGFFYQEHPNDAGCPSSPRGGYQICGYTTAATFGTAKYGHRAGSQVCTPRRSAIPTPFDCRGDRGTFNPFPNFGTVCSSYAKGGSNQDFCFDDKDDLSHFAYEVCSECGKCVTPIN